MLWCIRAKARFGSSLSPQTEGWGYSPVVSLRDRVITPPFMAEIISAISISLQKRLKQKNCGQSMKKL